MGSSASWSYQSLQRLSRLVVPAAHRDQLLRLRFAAELTYAEMGVALGQSEAAQNGDASFIGSFAR
jgi:hypothetical protein